MREPAHSNEIMGARIWWKWLTEPFTPWATLWTAKYASNHPTKELIRMSEVIMGSLIWNSAMQHRNLIQQHSFWEVKDNNTTKFWDDSWQQRPKLKDLISHLQLPEHDLQNYEKVRNFWNHPSTQDYRQRIKAD